MLLFCLSSQVGKIATAYYKALKIFVAVNSLTSPRYAAYKRVVENCTGRESSEEFLKYPISIPLSICPLWPYFSIVKRQRPKIFVDFALRLEKGTLDILHLQDLMLLLTMI